MSTPWGQAIEATEVNHFGPHYPSLGPLDQ